MRRFFVLALIILTACGGDGALEPVQTVDGSWNGEDNGVNLSLAMAQSDTIVTGNAIVLTEAGSGQATNASPARTRRRPRRSA